LMQWAQTPTKLRLGDEDEEMDEAGWVRGYLRRLRVWMVNDGESARFVLAYRIVRDGSGF
jgi:hypothetical protein